MAKATTKKPPKRTSKTKTALVPRPYGLNEKQWRFVVAYAADPNGAKAARAAGYSEHTAGEIGSQNLRKPAIGAAIQHLIDQRLRKFDITADMVLQGVARIAFTPQEEMPERKISEQLRAFELLGRFLQLWEPKPNGGSLVPGGDTQVARDKLLKMMADMARREAVDVHALSAEDDARDAKEPEKANG